MLEMGMVSLLHLVLSIGRERQICLRFGDAMAIVTANRR